MIGSGVGGGGAAAAVYESGGEEFSRRCGEDDHGRLLRPVLHGRKVMGGLVPLARSGARARILRPVSRLQPICRSERLRLPKGTYSIWTVPGEKEWTLIVNKESGQFHLNYNQSLDFGRTKMNVKTLPRSRLSVWIFGTRGKQGHAGAGLGDDEASIPFTV